MTSHLQYSICCEARSLALSRQPKGTGKTRVKFTQFVLHHVYISDNPINYTVRTVDMQAMHIHHSFQSINQNDERFELVFKKLVAGRKYRTDGETETAETEREEREREERETLRES